MAISTDGATAMPRLFYKPVNQRRRHSRARDPFRARLAPFATLAAVLSAPIPNRRDIRVQDITHPCDRFSPGDDIRVVVRGRDDKGRISLTHKELLGTWEENAADFYQGETVSGIIRTVEPYGAFVELSPNLAGLAEPKEGIEEGQLASVYIKSILPDKMKIKLIIIDAFDGECKRRPLQYRFFDNHMDFWRYSPECCSKEVVTDFRI